MAIVYTRTRADKCVNESSGNVTSFIIGITAKDDADSNDNTSSAYMDGIESITPKLEANLTKTDVDNAEAAFKAQTNEDGENIETQLANQILRKQAAYLRVEDSDYSNLPA